MKLGQAIKLCRQQRRMTQKELALAADVSVSYVSLLERGERTDPSLNSIERISSSLDVPISILLFIAAEDEELNCFSSEIKEKLSLLSYKLMREMG